MYVNTEILRDNRVPACGDLLYVPATDDVYLVCEFLERVLGEGKTKAVVRLKDGAMWTDFDKFIANTKYILLAEDTYGLTIGKLEDIW